MEIITMVPEVLKKTLSSADPRLVMLLCFLVRLAVLSLPLYIIPMYPPLLYPLQDAVASGSHSMLLAMGMQAERSGLFVIVTTGEPFAFYVGPDCTAWESIALFLALIIAVPGISLMRRATGLVPGILAVHAANMYRIASVAAAGSTIGESAAGMLHDFFWLYGLTAVVFFLWLVWLCICRRGAFALHGKKHIAGKTKNKTCA